MNKLKFLRSYFESLDRGDIMAKWNNDTPYSWEYVKWLEEFAIQYLEIKVRAHKIKKALANNEFNDN